ncbi:MAG: PAS domain S-box protein, partial [Melioribacteraceae bacterium]|nr:PAS domain S-box protein [Melioribacteraceae bacterium]
MKSDTHILKIFLNNIEAPSIIIEENQKIVEYNIFAKKIFSNIKTKLDIKKIIGARADELIKSLNKLISADSNKTETITLKLHEIDYNLNISKFQLSDKDYFLIKLNSKEEIKESSELQKIKIFTDEIEDFIESKEIFLIVELIKQSYPFTFISRQRFRRQIDKLNYGFWIKDTNGRFVIVNKMYTESVGIKQNEIEGKHEGEILRKDEYDVFKNIDSYIINTSNSVVFETYSRSSEKEILQNVEFPVCDIDDKVVAIIGFNQIARNEKVLKEKLEKLEKDKIKNEKFLKDQEDRKEEILAAQEKRKEEEKIAEEKRLAEIDDKLVKQEYIGSIGDKIELEVKVVFSKTFNSYYGQSTLYSLEDN